MTYHATQNGSFLRGLGHFEAADEADAIRKLREWAEARRGIDPQRCTVHVSPTHRMTDTGCACGQPWNDDYDCCETEVHPSGMRWDKTQRTFVPREEDAE